MRKSPVRCRSSIVSSGRRRNSSVRPARSRNTGTSASARARSSVKSGGSPAPPADCLLASGIVAPLLPPPTAAGRRGTPTLLAAAAFVCAAARSIELPIGMATGERIVIYMVEMDFPHPDREAEWNAWYLAHIRVLLTVPGFRASQRFKAIQATPAPYLALHEVASA